MAARGLSISLERLEQVALRERDLGEGYLWRQEIGRDLDSALERRDRRVICAETDMRAPEQKPSELGATRGRDHRHLEMGLGFVPVLPRERELSELQSCRPVPGVVVEYGLE